MPPVLILEIDPAAAQGMLDSLAGSLDGGFLKTNKEIARLSGRSVDITIRRGGRPDPFKPYADATKRQREALYTKTQGRLPVGGPAAMLRRSDALRKAASATAPGVAGSDLDVGPWGFENEVTLPYAERQDDERPFMVLQDADVETFTDLVFADVRVRCRQAERGTLKM